MNKEPDAASFWKGRILIQVQAEETNKPRLLMKTIQDDQVIKGADEMLVEQSYQVNCQAIAGLSLPEPGEVYHLQLRIADQEFTTKLEPTFYDGHKSDKDKSGGYIRWMEPIAENVDVKLPYHKIDTIDSVYIYLMKKVPLSGWKRVCFYRGHVKDFEKPEAEIKWLNMVPDLAIGDVKQAYKAGIIGIRLSINDVKNKGPLDWSKYP